MEQQDSQQDNPFIKIEGMQMTNRSRSQDDHKPDSNYDESDTNRQSDFQRKSVMMSTMKVGTFAKKHSNLDASNFADLLLSRKQIYNNLSRKVSSQSQNRNLSQMQNLNQLQSMQSQDHILSSNMIYELSSLDNIPPKKTRQSIVQQQQNAKYIQNKRDSLSYTILQDKLNIHNQQILKQYSHNLETHKRHSSMAETRQQESSKKSAIENTEQQQPFGLQIDQKYILDLHNAINQQFIKNEDIFRIFETKLSRLEELQDLILQYDLKGCIKQQDVSQFQQTLRMLLNELRVQSQNQIDNNRLQRQIEQKNIEIMNLKYQIKKMEQKSEFLLQQSSYYKDKNTDIQKEIVKQKRTILDVQKQNEENKQMNKRIKRRLEVVLEFDLKKKENSEEKRILTIQELMRDNEYYKRMLEVKNNEIQQNQSKFAKLQEKIDKYSQIIRILKDNKKSFDNKQQFSSNDLLQTLSSAKLPESLRFLNFQQKQETSQYIEQMLYHGLQVYQSNQEYQQMDQKKQQAIIKQFIIDRDVFSRLNTLLQILIDIGQDNSIDSIQAINEIFIQNVKKYVIDCDNINIWEIEQQTGLLSTQFYTEKKRGYSDFGAFGECISKKQCIIQQNYSKRVFYKNILESQQKQNYYVDNFFLIPLMNQQNKVIGLMELSNELKKDAHQQKEFGFQEQYLCQVIKLFLNIFIQKIKERQVYQMEIHNNQNLQTSYTQMLACNNRTELTQQTKLCLQQILGITNFRLYFIEQNSKDNSIIQKMEFYEELFDQKSKKYYYEKRTIVGSKGIIGFVAQYQGANIVNNLKESIHYDSNVDLYSVLPVYTLPVVKKNEERQNENVTIAVLQMVLKQRISTKIMQEDQMNDDVQIGLPETSESIAKLIVNGISVAIQNLK